MSNDRLHDRVMDFAHNKMRKIPRLAQKCEIYGTTRAVVDANHATNILKKIFPAATGPTIYYALHALQDRLDEAARR